MIVEPIAATLGRLLGRLSCSLGVVVPLPNGTTRVRVSQEFTPWRRRCRGSAFFGGISLIAITWVLFPSTSSAQDRQVVGVGDGLAFSECVEAGSNGAIDSTPAGDDDLFTLVSPPVIRSGRNGVCETVPSGDDVHPTNGVVFGGGLPNAPIIVSGLGDASDDGICDDPTIAAGDDVSIVPAGQSMPRRIAVLPGSDGVIDAGSTVGGDDVVTTVICPGIDLILNSTPASGSDDQIVLGHPLCARVECAQNLACIIPGNDDILQTSPDAQDVAAPYVSTGADGVAATTAAGDDSQQIVVGEGTKESTCVDAGPDGIAQTGLCGNAITDVGEQCDDGPGNSDTTPDACRADCSLPFCGDGITDPANGEGCDDGNGDNDDACVVGCQVAVCGDGFKWRSVEECDDGNTVAGDGCDENCAIEFLPECGNGVIDGLCAAGVVGGACATNTDCDSAPAAGDGVCDRELCDDGNNSNKDDCLVYCIPAFCGDGFLHEKGTGPFEQCDDANNQGGDGCSAICELECGNGLIDGACSQGTVGTGCAANVDCDSAPSAGDGICVTEECDPGIDGLCSAGPIFCSSACLIASCGNGEVECDEECDLGTSNGVTGSGCTVDCKRNLIGRRELVGIRECLGGWTLDSPPNDPKRKVQKCTQGSACDFDVNAAQCTFRVGFCLNRPEPAACTPGDIISVDLRRLRVDRSESAAAAEVLTTAIAALSPTTSSIPDRCRKGQKNKVCSIPDNAECDTFLGAGNGICDIGTGVSFSPPLAPADVGGSQVATCSPGVDVVVAVGGKLRLRSWVRRNGLKGDRDALVLRCLP